MILTRLPLQFRSFDTAFEFICSNITKDECIKARQTPNGSPPSICGGVHFRPLIRPHTDPSLGHCSYLNTCYSEPSYAQSPSIPPFPSNVPRPPGSANLPSGLGAGGRGKEKAPCRYVHFEVDYDGGEGDQQVSRPVARKPHKLGIGLGPTGKATPLVRGPNSLVNSEVDMSSQLPPQWINCDVRRFDYTVLGKFHVIMADPPWDIHMSVRHISASRLPRLTLQTSFLTVP